MWSQIIFMIWDFKTQSYFSLVLMSFCVNCLWHDLCDFPCVFRVWILVCCKWIIYFESPKVSCLVYWCEIRCVFVHWVCNCVLYDKVLNLLFGIWLTICGASVLLWLVVIWFPKDLNLMGLGYLEQGEEAKRKEGGYKVGWLTFCVTIQFFAKWRAFTCYYHGTIYFFSNLWLD